MKPSAVLAVVASVVFLARLLPQPLRSLRTGRIEGVSLLAAVNAAVADGAWMAYGLSAHLPAIWVVSLPAFVLSAFTAVILRGQATRRDLALGGGWTVVVAATAAAGPTALTLVLAATVVVCCGPTVWSAYRTRHPDGISPLTWLLAVADASSWGAYGVVVRSPALELYAVVMGITSAAMLSRMHATRGLAVAQTAAC